MLVPLLGSPTPPALQEPRLATLLSPKAAEHVPFISDPVNSLLSAACLAIALGSAAHAHAVKLSRATPNAAPEAGEWGQKGSAGLGDALQKRGLCKAACVCILSTVDGYLRIPLSSC